MKKIIFLSIFFFSVLKLFAQNYWQQEVKYKINVSLDDTRHILNGQLQVVYTNHSPSTLEYIYFHLWPNAFKDDNTEFAKQMLQMGKTDFHFSTDEEKGFIDSLSFYVNGKPAIFVIQEDTIDVGKLLLNQPLASGASITITTPFRVKIPKTFSRLGHDEQQYQITQWYPKPAVYDVSGWHPISYLDQGEFYGDYGSFDVSISLPKNYVVAATGELQNETEKYFLDTLASHTASLDAFADKGFPASSTETKTLHYTANDVHDFAWFADKRYQVLKGNVTLENKHQVNTWLFFTPKGGKIWKNALPYINNAVTYYSKWVGNYPYNNATAVEGKLEAGGGMEYPQITVIGKIDSKASLETVIVHEVGHNWFQGMLGSNERLHPWMDEGINSYYEQRYTKLIQKTKDEAAKTKLNRKNITLNLSKIFDGNDGNSMSYLGYAYSAWKNEDQPCELTSADYTPLNYYGDVYAKTPILFNYLTTTIGQNEFDSIMHIYFSKWQSKHPQPEDIRSVFNKNSKQNLEWFWYDAMNTTKKFDLELKFIHHDIQKIGNDEFYKITVVNNGNIRTPYTISSINNDTIVKTINYGGFLGEMQVLFPKGTFEKLKIDAQNIIPELDRQNNTSRVNGIFRKTEPLSIGNFGVLRSPNKNKISWLPLIGYNLYNGWMPGVIIYNPLLAGNLWNYQLVPMFGLRDKQFAFTGKLERNWIVNTSFINHVKAGIGANYFDEGTKIFNPDGSVANSYSYLRLRPFVEMNIRPQQLNSSLRQKIILASNIYFNGVNSKVKDGAATTNAINILTYEAADNQKLNPQKLILQVQQQNASAKLSITMEASHLYKKHKYINARFFAGYVHNENYNKPVFNLKMSGFRGTDDYLHDNMYIGRGETNSFWAHQMCLQEGGFRQATWIQSPIIGQSNSLLGALNFNFDLPISAPLTLYFDLGMYSAPKYIYSKVLYDGGITYKFSRNLQINFPIIASSDFIDNVNNVYSDKSGFAKWARRITFVWNLNEMNPVKAIQNFNVN